MKISQLSCLHLNRKHCIHSHMSMLKSPTTKRNVCSINKSQRFSAEPLTLYSNSYENITPSQNPNECSLAFANSNECILSILHSCQLPLLSSCVPCLTKYVGNPLRLTWKHTVHSDQSPIFRRCIPNAHNPSQSYSSSLDYFANHMKLSTPMLVETNHIATNHAHHHSSWSQWSSFHETKWYFLSTDSLRYSNLTTPYKCGLHEFRELLLYQWEKICHRK